MDEISTNFERVVQRVADIEQRLRELELADPAATPFAAHLSAAAPSPAAAPSVEMQAMIERAARQYNLRPDLLRAMVQVESGGNPRAVSPKGAMGLLQLMPGTAAGLGVDDPFDPQQNLDAGARYLRMQLDRFHGDERLAVAAYNAGPGAVLRHNGIPPYAETQGYVSRVLALSGVDR
jgi:soluble lytic murein transglycosylase-like protein